MIAEKYILPLDVNHRVGRRLDRISRDIQRIADDLAEFWVGYMKIDFGPTQVVIAGPDVLIDCQPQKP